jgi:hypothetical protein
MIIIPLFILLPYFLRLSPFLFIGQDSEYLPNTKGNRLVYTYTLLFFALALVGLYSYTYVRQYCHVY